MRILAVATMLALMVGPAQAQMGARRQPSDGPKVDKKTIVDEKAYKAALEKIPEAKEKYDPWSGARPSEPKKAETKKAETKKPK